MNNECAEPKSDVPLICIATGSGIAPIRSFWQQKILEFEENSQTSQIHLFFGCRDQSSDFFREETDPMEGKIMTRHSAYSRATDIPKGALPHHILLNFGIFKRPFIKYLYKYSKR